MKGTCKKLVSKRAFYTFVYLLPVVDDPVDTNTAPLSTRPALSNKSCGEALQSHRNNFESEYIPSTTAIAHAYLVTETAPEDVAVSGAREKRSAIA